MLCDLSFEGQLTEYAARNVGPVTISDNLWQVSFVVSTVSVAFISYALPNMNYQLQRKTAKHIPEHCIRWTNLLQIVLKPLQLLGIQSDRQPCMDQFRSSLTAVLKLLDSSVEAP